MGASPIYRSKVLSYLKKFDEDLSANNQNSQSQAKEHIKKWSVSIPQKPYGQWTDLQKSVCKLATATMKRSDSLQSLINDTPDIRYLKIVNIDTPHMFTKAFQTNTLHKLVSLNLQNNGIGPQGAQALAPGLGKLGNLTKLFLGLNDIGSQGAQALLKLKEQKGFSLYVD